MIPRLTTATPIGAHAHGSGSSLDMILFVVAGIAIGGYVVGILGSRARGRPWPLHRAILWFGGVVLATATLVGPLARAAHGDFVAHTWAHLLGGMLAPVLLVLAAPGTLALRTLAVTPARRLSRLLRSGPVRFIAHPVTATIISAGGLWLLYLSPVYGWMQADPLLHLGVQVHLLLVGCLFTAAVIGIDPRPHPSPRALVAALLVAAVASHGILAKHLYAHPPSSVTASTAAEGAQVMYYAGAWIEAAIIVVFCAQWYRAARPHDSPSQRARGRTKRAFRWRHVNPLIDRRSPPLA
jgi:putative membrane protein